MKLLSILCYITYKLVHSKAYLIWYTFFLIITICEKYKYFCKFKTYDNRCDKTFKF